MYMILGNNFGVYLSLYYYLKTAFYLIRKYKFDSPYKLLIPISPTTYAKVLSFIVISTRPIIRVRNTVGVLVEPLPKVAKVAFAVLFMSLLVTVITLR